MGQKRNLGQEVKKSEELKKAEARKAAKWSKQSIMRVAVLVVLGGFALALVVAAVGNIPGL